MYTPTLSEQEIRALPDDVLQRHQNDYPPILSPADDPGNVVRWAIVAELKRRREQK